MGCTEMKRLEDEIKKTEPQLSISARNKQPITKQNATNISDYYA